MTQFERQTAHLLQWQKKMKVIGASMNQNKILSIDAQAGESSSRDINKMENIQAMGQTNNGKYLLLGDKVGNIIYLDSVHTAVNFFSAHKENGIRDLSISMSSVKFVTCSDDRTARVFDLPTSKQEVEFKEHN